jgi:hypothetical protein
VAELIPAANAAVIPDDQVAAVKTEETVAESAETPNSDAVPGHATGTGAGH